MNDPHMPSHYGPGGSSPDAYPNETMRLLIERASCRSFVDKPIPPEVLQLMFEAGVQAATGGNLQQTRMGGKNWPNNEFYLQIMKEFGLHWFKTYPAKGKVNA